MLVEEFHQLGEVGERAGQPVDLVDHNDVDLPVSYIIQQFLKGRAIQGVGSVGTEMPVLSGSSYCWFLADQIIK
jgi:hypothetical protein